MTVHKFTNEIVEQIAIRLEKYKSDDELAKNYKWPLPVLPNHLCDQFLEFSSKQSDYHESSAYKKTIYLRKWIKVYLDSRSDELEKKIIYQWIVKNWGGIKTGDDENLMSVADQAIKDHRSNSEKFGFERISSWSKVLAFQYPNIRAIYDVRVIYSLNWILLQTNFSEKFFPTPSGRNSLINFFSYEKEIYKRVVGLSGIKSAFHKERERKVGSVKSSKSSIINTLSKQVYIDKNYAYQSYCNLLIDAAIKIYGEKDMLGVTKLEMILFSIADGDIVSEILGVY